MSNDREGTFYLMIFTAIIAVVIGLHVAKYVFREKDGAAPPEPARAMTAIVDGVGEVEVKSWRHVHPEGRLVELTLADGTEYTVSIHRVVLKRGPAR